MKTEREIRQRVSILKDSIAEHKEYGYKLEVYDDLVQELEVLMWVLKTN